MYKMYIITGWKTDYAWKNWTYDLCQTEEKKYLHISMDSFNVNLL